MTHFYKILSIVTIFVTLNQLRLVECQFTEKHFDVEEIDNQVDPTAETGQPLVYTKWSTIAGFYQLVNGKLVNVFLGIPYAEPPIGSLRFRSPVRLGSRFAGIYNATRDKPACMQSRHKMLETLADPWCDEDCLYLNIWVPGDMKTRPRRKPLPVLFYVFGSGFISSSATNPSHHGEFVSTFTDVIFIAANYRLGVFGLVYGGNPEMPGNQAVDDVKMAFEWVRENIHRFGGNPSRITLVGSSSGSIIASILTLSPLMSPFLFDQLILMSGVAARPASIESLPVALNKTMFLAAKLGCGVFPSPHKVITPEQMACLRLIDSHQLAIAEEDTQIVNLGHGPDIAFLPVYGTDLMPLPPDLELLSANVRRDLSILVGYDCNDDTISKKFFPTNKTNALDYLRQTLLHMVNITHDNQQDLHNLIADYFKDVAETDSIAAKRSLSQAIGDYVFHCPSLLYAEIWSKFDPVHLYYNTYIADGLADERPFCSYHGDANFMFLGKPFRRKDFSDRDRAVSKKMINVLSGFIKKAKLDWPTFLHDKDGRVLPIQWNIDESVNTNKISISQHRHRCHRWKKIMKLFH